MADPTVTTLPAGKSIGMDMVPPFAVYVDGQKVAEHATEEEADALYTQLRATHTAATRLVDFQTMRAAATRKARREARAAEGAA